MRIPWDNLDERLHLPRAHYAVRKARNTHVSRDSHTMIVMMIIGVVRFGSGTQ
jgi:hypothetical protein